MECTLNVRDFGAKGIAIPTETLKLANRVWQYLTLPEGTTATIYHPESDSVEYDSAGIQRAIDKAHSQGGGTVYVPSGDYLIAPIRLKSRVRLHLEHGARLWGSPFIKDYESGPGEPISSGIHAGFNRAKVGLNRVPRQLISAIAAEDVAITGGGQISEQSPKWVIPWMNEAATSRPTERPSDMFLFHRCRRVRIEGIRIVDSTAWTLVFDECTGVRVRSIEIENFDVINADGIDLHATSDVMISDCDLHVMDDAICLKNTKPDVTMGNIAITNCVIRTLCNGVKIGTDTCGNFENIAVSNVVIQNPDDDVKFAEGGINLNAIDGGHVRGVAVSNVTMRNVICPFYLVLGCRTKQQESYRTPRPGDMEAISISHVVAYGSEEPCFIVGHPERSIRGIDLHDIRIRKTRGTRTSSIGVPVPEKPTAYPGPYMFGNRAEGGQFPAYGLYVRHAEDLVLRDFTTTAEEPEARPMILFDDCADVTSDRPVSSRPQAGRTRRHQEM